MNNKAITLGVLMASTNSLGVLAKASLPIHLGFRVSKLLKEIGPILEEGFKKQDELIEHHKKTNIQKDFNTDRDKLYAEEVEINFQNIDMKDLVENAVGLMIAPADLLSLEWLIKDDSK